MKFPNLQIFELAILKAEKLRNGTCFVVVVVFFVLFCFVLFCLVKVTATPLVLCSHLMKKKGHVHKAVDDLFGSAKFSSEFLQIKKKRTNYMCVQPSGQRTKSKHISSVTYNMFSWSDFNYLLPTECLSNQKNMSVQNGTSLAL